jgi:hypothetical protein
MGTDIPAPPSSPTPHTHMHIFIILQLTVNVHVRPMEFLGYPSYSRKDIELLKGYFFSFGCLFLS